MIRIFLLMTVGAALVQAEAGETKPYRTAAENRIEAQMLVNSLLADYPALVTAGLHCRPPEGGPQTIIASTLNVIGKPSDPEDVDVGVRGFTQLVPNLKLGKLGIMLPLHDQAGNRIGALALAFKYREGDDQVQLFARATEIRARLAQKIPSLSDLFKPAP